MILNLYYTDIYQALKEDTRYGAISSAYGLGSGNSIYKYASVEGLMVMVDAVKEISRNEKIKQQIYVQQICITF